MYAKISPPKIGPEGLILAEKLVPPDQFWQLKLVPPLSKMVPMHVKLKVNTQCQHSMNID